jgi:hypothetical protein
MKLAKTPLEKYFPEYTGEHVTRDLVASVLETDQDLFPCFRWFRYKQSRKVYPLALHPDEPGTTECVPASDAGD